MGLRRHGSATPWLSLLPPLGSRCYHPLVSRHQFNRSKSGNVASLAADMYYQTAAPWFTTPGLTTRWLTTPCFTTAPFI